MPLMQVLPGEIEKRSMEIIESELPLPLPAEHAAIIKRVIHTTADFDYVENLVFTQGVVPDAIEALNKGLTIVTDTKMAESGINKAALAALNCRVVCFMDDVGVAQAAKENGTTRAVAAMEKAVALPGALAFAIGNAPTALVKLCELTRGGVLAPKFVIGTPVGFVNVVESKEMLLQTNVPSIVARGRKGGSNVAAAIGNALLYLATGRVI